MNFGPDLPQKREVVTEIPGPNSKALADRRKAAVSSALGAAVPIYADRAGGGVIVDVDGNSFIDLGAGIAVVNVGNSCTQGRRTDVRAGPQAHPHVLHGGGL